MNSNNPTKIDRDISDLDPGTAGWRKSFNTHNKAWILEYSFILQVAVTFLDDSSALARLLLVNKSVKPFLMNWQVHNYVRQSMLVCIFSPHRYCPVVITSVKEVTSLHELNAIAEKPFTYAYIQHKADPSLYGRLRLKRLVFHKDFRDEIAIGDIPSGVEYLVFLNGTGHHLEAGTIPNTVKHLVIGGVATSDYGRELTKVHQSFESGTIPSSVTYLWLNAYGMADLIPGDIPKSVEYLGFGDLSDPELYPESIPASVTHLTFSCPRERVLRPGIIPSSVKYLRFDQYTKDVLFVGSIPESVETLVIVARPYHHPPLRSELLPRSLKMLLSDMRSTSPLLTTFNLPSGLTHLAFATKKDSSHCLLPNMFPQSLEEVRLQIYGDCEGLPGGLFPFRTTKLELRELRRCDEAAAFPVALTHLEVHFRERILDDLHLPSLKRLVTSNPDYLGMPTGVPNSVTRLTLHIGEWTSCGSAETIAPGTIPRSVTHLTISNLVGCRVHPSALPDSITHLHLFNVNAHALSNLVIPPSVTHLSLEGLIASIDLSAIPPSVTHVKIAFSCQLKSVDLSPNVTHFEFRELYRVLDKCSLPGVTHLTLSYDEALDYSLLMSLPSLTHVTFMPTIYEWERDRFSIPVIKEKSIYD